LKRKKNHFAKKLEEKEPPGKTNTGTLVIKHKKKLENRGGKKQTEEKGAGAFTRQQPSEKIKEVGPKATLAKKGVTACHIPALDIGAETCRRNLWKRGGKKDDVKRKTH